MSFGITIQVFDDGYGVHCPISFNDDKVVTLIMNNINIT
jgi:hypothetical protein